jgi:hypothetical protein
LNARALAAAVFLAACGAASAEETRDLYYVEDPATFGRPKRIVAPEYPKDALSRHVTGYVDVRGHVTPLLSFADAQYSPDTPEAAVFIEPIKEVLHYWEFYSVTGNDCFPSDKTVKVRVVFEIEDEKPKISVSMDKMQGATGQQIKVLNRRNPIYPRAAMRSGAQAYVYSRSEFKPDGTVSKVETAVYPPRPAYDALPFEEAVKSALIHWTYTPSPEGQTRMRTACHQVIFQLNH